MRRQSKTSAMMNMKEAFEAFMKEHKAKYVDEYEAKIGGSAARSMQARETKTPIKYKIVSADSPTGVEYNAVEDVCFIGSYRLRIGSLDRGAGQTRPHPSYVAVVVRVFGGVLLDRRVEKRCEQPGATSRGVLPSEIAAGDWC